ncbi:MAG TPA: GrpB family protein [Streptosporangiaceae bacterium]
MRPVVVAYRADWPDRAATLTASLRDRLGPRAERIEHIGSTSIPGMAAKDILDMQVSVAGLAEAASAFDEPLAGLGFERVPYDDYSDIKDPVVDVVIAAEEWAMATGWRA